MALQIHKAERKRSRLRLGISGPSGSGKTYGALKVAFGLGGKVGIVDTENGSGELYAHLGEYDAVTLTAPYTVAKYLEAIRLFEQSGYGVIVIDSLSHAWAGEGGLLDKQGKLAQGKNSYTAWREVTPEHNALIEAMLTSPAHIIGTMRSKTEYVVETNDRGKAEPKKVGMAPVQREGMEYEFTVHLEVDAGHNAKASKDRTGLLDGQIFRLSEQTGQALREWLESGVDAPVAAVEAPEPPKPVPAPQTDAPAMTAAQESLAQMFRAKGWKQHQVRDFFEECGYERPQDIAVQLRSLADDACAELLGLLQQPEEEVA